MSLKLILRNINFFLLKEQCPWLQRFLFSFCCCSQCQKFFLFYSELVLVREHVLEQLACSFIPAAGCELSLKPQFMYLRTVRVNQKRRWCPVKSKNCPEYYWQFHSLNGRWAQVRLLLPETMWIEHMGESRKLHQSEFKIDENSRTL